MKKNITSILQRGNIKPSDRVKLLVADMASKERDGKALLTEADKHALSEGWTPKNNEEVREYNRFNEGWKNVAYAEMDAQTTYLQATNSFLRASKYISYIIQKDRYKIKKDDKSLDSLKNTFADGALKSIIEKGKEGEALNLVLGYLGLELDYTIYLYAFELAGEQLQKDLLALYPDAKTERSYLEQEEIIYNLFNGKDKLSKTDKEKLAELIADKCFYKYFGEWSFGGYYADIPLIEIVRKWADNNKINYEVSDKDLVEAEQKQKQAKDANSLIAGDKSLDTPEGKELRKEKLTAKILPEKLTAYAKENKREIKDIITETILKWLDEDLMDEYAPLFKSDKKATCNEQDTKLTHKELFKKWLDVKAKATETIQGLIDKGELKTERKTKDFGRVKKSIEEILATAIDFKGKTGQDRQDTPITETKTIITGESLYNLKGDYQFIKDFREQAEDFKIFGALVLFLRECSFVKDYSTLLAFELLFKELSKTFETDLTYSIKKWIGKFRDELKLFTIEFLMLADDITEASYKADRVYYLTESYLEELLTMPFDPDKIKPDMDGRIKVYAGKIKDILQDDFKNPFDYEK
jgi:ribosomal protein S16